MLVLTVIQGPDKGKRFELPMNEPQLIGRSSEALPLSDNTVSRRHAELTPDDGVWYLRDLHSQNGTYLNGRRLGDRALLRPGDQVRVGSTLFVFGETDSDALDVVRLMRPEQMEADFERTLPSRAYATFELRGGPNEDSVILSEPEPRTAAIDHLRIIYALTTLTTTQVMDRPQLLRSVLDLVFSEFRPERGVIMLKDEHSGELRPAAVKYKEKPRGKDQAEIHVSRTILQHCIKRSEGVLSSNAMADPRFMSGDSVQQFHIRSAICSPIRMRDRTFGAIYIDSSIANYTFTAEQLALMNAIGQHTGLALANAELYNEKLHSERLAAIGETVASLSHSIKNILQGLRGGADVVEMGLKKDDLKIARGGWDILKRNLDRIVALTLNMLAYSRQRTIEIELTKLGPLIEDCVSLLQDRCKEKQVALVVDADPEMPPVPIDPNLMHQALMNLVSNAVDAVEGGKGIVTVRTTYIDPDPLLGLGNAYAEIEVIDNGPGIPQDRQAWIFEPFRTTKGLKGTGLGLAVTQRIIQEHRGRIVIESEENVGARFKIILPVDAVEDLDPSATAQSRSPGLPENL
ncbi:MAG: ATP-binding protein [Phycisphaerales bacterium]